MSRGEWVLATCATAAIAAGAIAFARSAAAQSSSSNPVILTLAVLVGLAVLGGSIAFGLKASESSQRTRYLISTQVRLAFEDLAPQIGATVVVPQPLEHPIAGSVAPFPVLRGNYRGHCVRMWFSVQDPESGAGMGIGIAVLSADGLRWPRYPRLRPETRIDGAPRTVDLLARLADPHRKPYRLNDVELAPTELSCVAEHVGPALVEIEGTKVRPYADSAQLMQILDELTTLADMLPSAAGRVATPPTVENPCRER